MNELNSDRALLQSRMIHAHKTLCDFDLVDVSKTGAIGFVLGKVCNRSRESR